MKPVFFTALLTLVAGCGHHHHHRHASHAPPPPLTPPPASKPAVVVVTPVPSRPPQAPAPTASRPAKEPWLDVTITTGERQVIREYVVVYDDNGNHGKHGKKGKGKSLPPGLAKKSARGESLPPGWQKKLRRGEVMPEQVYRKCHPLPEEVIVKLPPPPPGTILVTIEGKVVRLLQATLEILDVFDVHV